MIHSKSFKRCNRVAWCAAILALSVLQSLAQQPPVGRTSITIEVKEAETGQPINSAHLTLQFQEPSKQLRPGKHLAFSAKTNPQGRYKFVDIPKVTVRLMVTADHRQSFGKEIEITEDNQVIAVKLKRPQPLL